MGYGCLCLTHFWGVEAVRRKGGAGVSSMVRLVLRFFVSFPTTLAWRLIRANDTSDPFLCVRYFDVSFFRNPIPRR